MFKVSDPGNPPKKGPFDESSDSDSVKTDYTSESDGEGDYSVDKILAEWPDYYDSGVTHYLLKWSGYPLAKCTWEPEENIHSRIILDDWNRKKASVDQAKEIQKFEEAVEKAQAAKRDRRRRRKEKRQKRGSAC